MEAVEDINQAFSKALEAKEEDGMLFAWVHCILLVRLKILSGEIRNDRL